MTTRPTRDDDYTPAALDRDQADDTDDDTPSAEPPARPDGTPPPPSEAPRVTAHAATPAAPTGRALNIVLLRGPGPDSDFVEVETDDGRSVHVGQWIPHRDGLVALRITPDDLHPDPQLTDDALTLARLRALLREHPTTEVPLIPLDELTRILGDPQ